MDIECPGDVIAYNCFVLSNSESVQLTWRVTIPGLESFNITYDTFSPINIEEGVGSSNSSSAVNIEERIGMSITTTLNNFMADEFIESTIVFTVLNDVTLNGTGLECISEDLDTDFVVVLVNTSGTQAESIVFLS